ncbi:MAG: LysE family transporter [Nitrospirota bacterium]
MYSLASIFAGSFVIGFTGAIMPGPVLTLTISQAARGGWRSGPMIAFGHGLLEFLLVMAVMIGLGRVLTAPLVMKTLGITGGLTLAVMGAAAILKAGGGSGPGEDRPAMAPVRWTVSGAVVSASNPYFIIWWATVGLGYLALAGRLGVSGVAAFYFGHVLSDILWYTVVAALISSGKGFMGTRGYRVLTVFCGAVLVLFGGLFVFKTLH